MSTTDNVWVTGLLFAVEVTGVLDLNSDRSSATDFPVSPQVIASQVGGTVVTG